MIAVLTDFGCSEYLGVMKGVIYSIAKKAVIIDLANNISAQNIREGAWVLLTTYKYFPKNTIFLCVVDPGVGGERQNVVIRTNNYYFVGPDNGVMYPAASDDVVKGAIRINEDKNASKTFHGRDVYAKAAAKLITNKNLNKIGVKTKLQNRFNFHLNGRAGEIVRIDHFGNIITNLPASGKKIYSVNVNGFSNSLRFYSTYEEAKEKELFIIKGSANTLEISVKNGNVNEKLKWFVGDIIEILDI